MSEFKPIETQEELNNVIRERLEQQERVIRKDYEGYKSPDEVSELTKGFEAQLKELQGKADTTKADLEEKLRQATAGAEAATLEVTRMRVASEMGIPVELAQRLSGVDEDSIREDAKTLAKYTANINAGTPMADPERPVGDALEESFRRMAQELNTK